MASAILCATVGMTTANAALIEITQDQLVTTEAGDSDSFLMHLTERPTHTISIDVNIGDYTEVSSNTSTIVFSTDNWNQTQEIFITGIDDADIDGDILSLISFGPAISSDLTYSGFQVSSVEVLNIDNDSHVVPVPAAAWLFGSALIGLSAVGRSRTKS